MNRPTKYIFIIFIAAFCVIAVLVFSGLLAEEDNAVISAIRGFQSTSLTMFFKFISNLGQWFIYVPITVLFLAIPKLRVKIGLPVAVALIAALLADNLLKVIFARPRPVFDQLVSAQGYSFPSGHSMTGTAFVCICVFLFLRYSVKSPLKICVVVISVGFLLLLGISRIYLGVHYPSDVLAGYFAGLVIALFVFHLFNSYWLNGQLKKGNYLLIKNH